MTRLIVLSSALFTLYQPMTTLFAGEAFAQSAKAASPTSLTKCEEITEGGPVIAVGVKPQQLCPGIATLVDTFGKKITDYAPYIDYSKENIAFYTGLGDSLRHYKGRSTVAVRIPSGVSLTLDSLDTLEEGNGYKRNKLGLILERIRNKRARGVCLQTAEVDGGATLLTWLGTQALKFGLPALIRTVRGDPTKVVEKYDALVTVERGSSPDLNKRQIRSIQFVPAGKLPMACPKQ